jgi:hypothetical protein
MKKSQVAGLTALVSCLVSAPAAQADVSSVLADAGKALFAPAVKIDPKMIQLAKDAEDRKQQEQIEDASGLSACLDEQDTYHDGVVLLNQKPTEFRGKNGYFLSVGGQTYFQPQCELPNEPAYSNGIPAECKSKSVILGVGTVTIGRQPGNTYFTVDKSALKSTLKMVAPMLIPGGRPSFVMSPLSDEELKALVYEKVLAGLKQDRESLDQAKAYQPPSEAEVLGDLKSIARLAENGQLYDQYGRDRYGRGASLVSLLTAERRGGVNDFERAFNDLMSLKAEAFRKAHESSESIQKRMDIDRYEYVKALEREAAARRAHDDAAAEREDEKVKSLHAEIAHLNRANSEAVRAEREFARTQNEAYGRLRAAERTDIGVFFSGVARDHRLGEHGVLDSIVDQTYRWNACREYARKKGEVVLEKTVSQEIDEIDRMKMRIKSRATNVYAVKASQVFDLNDLIHLDEGAHGGKSKLRDATIGDLYDAYRSYGSHAGGARGY